MAYRDTANWHKHTRVPNYALTFSIWAPHKGIRLTWITFISTYELSLATWAFTDLPRRHHGLAIPSCYAFVNVEKIAPVSVPKTFHEIAYPADETLVIEKAAYA